jgi:serine/threonine-protein kinase RsbW
MPSHDEEPFTGSRVLLSLRLSRDPASVTLARDLTGGVLRGLGVTSACVDDVRLVVSEACTNAVKYATTADDYRVRITVDDHLCTIEVLDSGQGFDLRTVSDEMPAPDAPSGRGVALMRYLTDDLEVRSDAEQGTTVRMAKLLVMEPDAGARSGAPGRSDGHVDGPLGAEEAYDSNPPKPPR